MYQKYYCKKEYVINGYFKTNGQKETFKELFIPYPICPIGIANLDSDLIIRVN